MKCYLLLRKNVETGPFTLDELTAQTLTPTDLIWVEGQSTAWKYPFEIEKLQPFVAEPDLTDEPGIKQATVITTSKGIFVALPPQAPAQYGCFTHLEQKEDVELETRFSQPLEELQQQYYDAKRYAPFRFSKTFSKPHNVLWLGCVFAGLLFSAVLIKKIVEAYDEDAAGITAAAAMPINNMDKPNEAAEENMVQNALTTEVVPVDTATMKPVKHERAKVDLKKFVFLEANDYQVGLFGGIKNLRMLVVNKSAFMLDHVKFELQFLKPNGDVVKTEMLMLKSIAPKSSKSLAIPANKRGVKVNFHITGIHSRQNSDALVNL